MTSYTRSTLYIYGQCIISTHALISFGYLKPPFPVVRYISVLVSHNHGVPLFEDKFFLIWWTDCDSGGFNQIVTRIFQNVASKLLTTPVPPKPHASKDIQIALILHPCDTSEVTVGDGLVTALANVIVWVVLVRPMVTTWIFLIEFTGRRLREP